MTRSEELRRRNRRVLGVSFGVAALAHVALFVFAPTFSAQSLVESSGIVALPEYPTEGGTLVDVYFGPPAIFLDDRSLHEEPSSRTLEQRNIDIAAMRLERRCRETLERRSDPVYAAVQLRLRSNGRVATAAIHTTTGDGCTDELLLGIAEAVWYQWIPDDRFPAPVDLIQPMTVTWAD